MAIGGGWIGVINVEEIRVFDYGGNELYCMDFDRRFVTM